MGVSPDSKFLSAFQGFASIRVCAQSQGSRTMVLSPYPLDSREGSPYFRKTNRFSSSFPKPKSLQGKPLCLYSQSHPYVFTVAPFGRARLCSPMLPCCFCRGDGQLRTVQPQLSSEYRYAVAEIWVIASSIMI